MINYPYWEKRINLAPTMRLSVKLFVAASLFFVPLCMSAQISKEQIKTPVRDKK